MRFSAPVIRLRPEEITGALKRTLQALPAFLDQLRQLVFCRFQLHWILLILRPALYLFIDDRIDCIVPRLRRREFDVVVILQALANQFQSKRWKGAGWIRC